VPSRVAVRRAARRTGASSTTGRAYTRSHHTCTDVSIVSPAMPNPDTPIALAEKLATFAEHWSPRVVAELNDYQFKLVKLLGDFPWHVHHDTDEAFLVVHGAMAIDFRDRSVTLRAGELFVVPRGVEHRTRAEAECHAMIVEPRGVVNTGDAGGPLTAANDVWA
jgi:mannose-6-phosphate isomerase-like protein (cupin superfamily)